MKYYTALSAIGSIATPIAPAASIGWEAYAWMLAESGQPALALASGIGSAVGMEIVAALAGHTSLQLYRTQDERWMLAALIMCLYVVAGLFHLGATIGGIMFVIAAAFYLLVALRSDSAEIATQQLAMKTDKIEFGRELEREKLRLAHEAKLKRIEAKATIEVAQASIMPARPSIEVAVPKHKCSCGRSFGSPQALGAHSRFCEKE